MRALIFILLLLPVNVVAQSEGHEWMLDDLRSCYSATAHEAKIDCIGRISEKCQEVEDGGYSTLGMSSCNNDEYQAWDVLLNEEYKLVMAAFKAQDLDDEIYYPELAIRVESLRTAQRAWIAFRDAECNLAYSIWGSGSMRNIAGTACLLEKTGKRTVDLWLMRELY